MLARDGSRWEGINETPWTGVTPYRCNWVTAHRRGSGRAGAWALGWGPWWWWRFTCLDVSLWETGRSARVVGALGCNLPEVLGARLGVLLVWLCAGFGSLAAPSCGRKRVQKKGKVVMEEEEGCLSDSVGASVLQHGPKGLCQAGITP